jgi:GNAT superfamily N-acetyltransferase
MATIRNARPDDLEAIYEISLLTGEAGQDASALYRDRKMIGHIYSAPYVTLSPETSFVVEDTDGVAGYVVGPYDTPVFEDCLEREWWPALRARYPAPQGDPEGWNADQRRSFTIHNPQRAFAARAAEFPAHIHMNMLPRLQGQGLGTRLLDRWMTSARQAGVKGVHLGTNAGNIGGQRFWASRGFERLAQPFVDPTDRSIWFGQYL